MKLVAVGVLFGGPSETIRGLRHDGRDERFAMIDLQAIAGIAYVFSVVLARLRG